MPPLFEMMLRAPALVPPIVTFGESTSMPRLKLPRGASPVTSTPM